MGMKIDPPAVLAVISDQALRIAQLEKENETLKSQCENFKSALEQIGKERQEAAESNDGLAFSDEDY